MLKKKLQIIYIILFFAICITPVVCMPFVKADETAENRKLSEMPSFAKEDGSANLDWPSEFETYLSEHFAFRQELVTFDSVQKAEIFQTSSNEKIVVGDNDWLYFASTLDDYMSRNTLSERRIDNTAKTLKLIQEYAEENGAEFLFISAPNKNTVYPQNMPSRYVKSGEPNNLEMLSAVLDEYEVNQIVLKDLFLSQDKVLYHSRDSHWTNEGAVLVHNAIMDKLGIEHNDFSDVNHHTEQCWEGDLDSMIFPTLNILSEEEIYDIDYSFEYIGSFQTVDDMLIRTVNGNREHSILMYRDSFGRSLYPFIAENTFKAEFSREIPYRLNMLSTFPAEYVVLEIVERNIPNITEKAPIMAAPSRSLDISADIYKSDKNVCEVKKENGMLKIHGILDEYYFKGKTDIYVTFEGENGVFCFEAFPICEAELLGDDEQSDFGFSLYVDTTDIPSGEYSVNAYIGDSDDLICTDEIYSIIIDN